MTAPRLPDLATLTERQKDALIVSLYETLLALDGAAPPPPAAAADAAELRQRIAAAAPSRRNQRGVGAAASPRWLGIFDSRAVQLVVLLVGFGFLADFGIGWAQRRASAEAEAATLALRQAAFGGLYVELTRIDYEPDGGYRATMVMQNADPARPLYILMSPVQVYVQAGLNWREVPAGAPPGTAWGVTRLEGGAEYAVIFRVAAADWAELIPGYVHVRIDSRMLISQSPEPKDDIVERANSFYAYLKPQGADDDAIRRRSAFPGAPPLFIPMPPH